MGLLQPTPVGDETSKYFYLTLIFRRNILEVLYDFRHTTPNIPPDYLFDLIPAIKQRSFSIASSPTHHQAVLELLVAVVNYRTNLKSPRCGYEGLNDVG